MKYNNYDNAIININAVSATDANLKEALTTIANCEKDELTACLRGAYHAYVVARDRLWLNAVTADGEKPYEGDANPNKLFSDVFGWSKARTQEKISVGRYFMTKDNAGRVVVRPAVRGYAWSALIEFAKFAPYVSGPDALCYCLKIWLSDNGITTRTSVRDIRKFLRADLRELAGTVTVKIDNANDSNASERSDVVKIDSAENMSAVFADICTVATVLDGADASVIDAFMRIVKTVKTLSGADAHSVSTENLYKIMGVNSAK